MKLYIVLPLLILTVGCQSAKKLLGTDHEQAQANPVSAGIPDDILIEGITATNYDVVAAVTNGRTITVEIFNSTTELFEALGVRDFTVRIGDIQTVTFNKKGGGGPFSSHPPAAPAGTQYRIHSVKA